MKEVLITIAVLIGLLIVVIVMNPLTRLYFVALLAPNPSKPEIAYGEFDFRLTYELEGEIKVIEDTIICEFDGFKFGADDKERKWKSHLKSGNAEITLLDLREKEVVDNRGRILELYFYWGDAQYYMDDNSYPYVKGAQDFKKVDYIYQMDDGAIRYESYSAEKAWEKFKIKLISWECDPPIENKFK